MVRPRGIILLVEDGDDDVFVLQKGFARAGLPQPLSHVQSGRQAIRYLSGEAEFGDRTLFPLPSLVLLDMKLPDMAGLEVLKWIRMQEDYSLLRVVVISGTAAQGDMQLAYQLGANSFLIKPSNFTATVEMCRSLIDFWLQTAVAPLPGTHFSPERPRTRPHAS